MVGIAELVLDNQDHAIGLILAYHIKGIAADRALGGLKSSSIPSASASRSAFWESHGVKFKASCGQMDLGFTCSKRPRS